ncbi:MAG TPA: hypothetical protein VLN49_12585 [Gemmatimonadaceae bacterium]|nr:hypothetical protein [Gemmatimonadaceae bacterium]
MSASTRFSSPAVRAGVVAIVVALGVATKTVVGVVRAAPIPDVPTTTSLDVAQLTRGPLPPPADIQSAVENDLFSPDRSAPSAPYRMPGERDASDEPVAEPVKPAVLGTAVATDGRNFATMQLGDERPILVHVGDKIGEWTVKSIGRGKVVLVTAAGARADLTVAKPGT